MSGYFIAEEGPLAGMVISFEEDREGNVWSLGRDPETSDVSLEDPMVSRRHALIRLTPEGFIFENLSAVNPATQNGMVIADPVRLKEGDIIQIGTTFFRFTEKAPLISAPAKQPASSLEGEKSSLGPSSELHFGPSPDTRWLLKVISGPNTGAEFAMHRGSTYLIGKDPNICDIVFQDLSVSRQHARLSVDREDNAFVEDLGSRNGVIVNGELIDEKQLLSSQDLVALGTTTFLVIDRKEPRETIFSSPSAKAQAAEASRASATHVEGEKRKDWRDLIIPKKHLAMAGTLGVLIFLGIFATFSLFKSKPIELVKVDKEGSIREALSGFPGVQFAFNAGSGKVFLTGDVMTTIRHQELLYKLKEVPFVSSVEDNVVIDELVWQSFNEMLSSNPQWVGVSLYAPEPGQFVLRGYLETSEQADQLSDYVYRNFDYLDKLSNQVVIEKNLAMEIESLLQEKGFYSIQYSLSNGEVVLSGRLDQSQYQTFLGLVHEMGAFKGIRTVKDYVIPTKAGSSRMNLSSSYAISGYSTGDGNEFFVVINGRILGKGDLLDGMLITQIDPHEVHLKKEGMEFKIDYNVQ